MPALFPQAVGHARPLPRRAPGPLRRRGLACTNGHEAVGARSLVEFRTPRKAAVDHHRYAVQRQRRLGDSGGEDDASPSVRVAPDRRLLRARLDLAVQRQDRRVRHRFGQPFAHALDFPDAGQEGEDVARLVAPGLADRARHAVLDPLLRTRAQPFDAQGMRAALAFDDGRIVAQQPGEAGAVDRGAHHHHAQVLAQDVAAFQCEGEAEVAVEVPFVRLVEQNGGNARQFRIGKDAIDENSLGYDEDARARRLPRVEPGRVADRLAGLFSELRGHALRRRTGGNAARAEQEDSAIAPRLVQQGGSDGGGLARPRRCDQDRAGTGAQAGQQVRQDGVDG